MSDLFNLYLYNNRPAP